MKYRIIKYGYKNPYYIAQYVDMDDQEWKTVKEPLRGASFLTPYQAPQHFSTLKAARKALRKIARAQIERDRLRVIEEDTI